MVSYSLYRDVYTSAMTVLVFGSALRILLPSAVTRMSPAGSEGVGAVLMRRNRAGGVGGGMKYVYYKGHENRHKT